MNFNLIASVNILERTPAVLNSLLKDLPGGWTMNNEGGNTWSPHLILGHLIEGEKTDWIVRAEIILGDRQNKEFEPFNMTTHLQDTVGRSVNELLNDFTLLREDNLRKLNVFNITDDQFELTGIHPEFGKITLRQLLSTWVTHDLGHIAQITRVMAKQYKNEVGPWKKYLAILKDR